MTVEGKGAKYGSTRWHEQLYYFARQSVTKQCESRSGQSCIQNLENQKIVVPTSKRNWSATPRKRNVGDRRARTRSPNTTQTHIIIKKARGKHQRNIHTVRVGTSFRKQWNCVGVSFLVFENVLREFFGPCGNYLFGGPLCGV